MKKDILDIKLEKFEIIWFIANLLLLLVSLILIRESMLGTITSLLGMINVLLVAKRSMWNYLFGIIYVILYAYIAYTAGYGGDFVTFTFYYLPLQFVGIYFWMNHMNVEDGNAEVESRKLSTSGWVLLIVNLIVGTYLTTLLLPAITALFNMPINQLPVMDAFTTYAGITGGVLMAIRYREQWIIWILVDVGGAIMWVAMLGKSPQAMAMIIMMIAYTANAIYGTYKWYK